jgi:hypothetical protein
MDFSDKFTFELIHYTIGCKCIKCYKKYYPYKKQYINIANIKNNRVITYELCYDCLNDVLNEKCSNCKVINKDNKELEYYLDIKSGKVLCSNCI